jgi:CRISPR-associated endonuclease/helicase Cas3
VGADIKILKSHPDKFLLDHIKGVQENVKQLTASKLAEVAVIFHDLGKINPNFQNNLLRKNASGYSNHSYLSAYAFFCAFCGSKHNRQILCEFLAINQLTNNDIIALIVMIAKHHGNLPDFVPKDNDGDGASILSKNEISELFDFLRTQSYIPVYEYVSHFLAAENFSQFLTNIKAQSYFLDGLIFGVENNQRPLDFYLNYQFAFAGLIQADKADAGKTGNIISQQKEDVRNFSKEFGSHLDFYLSKLNQDSELNKLRTNIRNDAIHNLRKELSNNERVFDLTAPTGSGKTLMLLSLASEIIKEKSAKRIIYALPFLSITEQVESEILKIFENKSDYIQRVDSKSENKRFEKIQSDLENEVSEEKLHELNILEFQENTFSYPLVITTFVRFFETLLSNKNSELLKLPNFSDCIFLIDEIQALPPRLYGFFVAYITKFCQKFDSYAIISTATQPNFELPINNLKAKEFFYDYNKPKSLLQLNYFQNELFNRYKIEYLNNNIDIDSLKERILSENTSVLVILNTIDDTKELYKRLKADCCADYLLLLNTHFTVRDRKLKIYLAKRKLRQNKRIIVISTQLIEAGVDIDFPIVYRDFATVASIVQSAGRCNRNGKLPNLGKVVLFRLERNGKVRSEIIYQGKDQEILRFTKQAIANDSYMEKELLQVQQEFFNRIQSELNFAQHSQNYPKIEFDFLKDIQECMYEKIGKFQLIDKQLYGEELQYYIPKNNRDSNFEILLSMQEEFMALLKKDADISTLKRQKNKMKSQLKKMSNQIVQIRLKKGQMKPGYESQYFDMYKIDLNYYSFENGIDLQGGECIL